MNPSDGSCGVVGVFVIQRRPLLRSRRVTSVNVPPTSRAMAYRLTGCCTAGGMSCGAPAHSWRGSWWAKAPDVSNLHRTRAARCRARSPRVRIPVVAASNVLERQARCARSRRCLISRVAVGHEFAHRACTRAVRELAGGEGDEVFRVGAKRVGAHPEHSSLRGYGRLDANINVALARPQASPTVDLPARRGPLP